MKLATIPVRCDGGPHDGEIYVVDPDYATGGVWLVHARDGVTIGGYYRYDNGRLVYDPKGGEGDDDE